MQNLNGVRAVEEGDRADKKKSLKIIFLELGTVNNK
jgi:hypothetical protein